jgi:DNA-binding beta-propeller fold protein YncE
VKPDLCHRAGILLGLLLLASACGLPFGPSAGSQNANIAGYRVMRDVRLPGDTSRWDYLAYDSSAHRLYIAHLGASEVVVFDTEQQKVAGVVRDVPGVHGLVVAPQLGRLYASATDKYRVDVIDTPRLRVVASTPTGRYPDGLAFVPSLAKVYVSNEQDSVDTVLDARSGRRLGSVPVGGNIGNSYYDPGSGLVYVASGSDNHLVAVDPTTDRVMGRYGLAGCDGAHGVQTDVPEQHRVFVTCESNSKLLVFDLRTKTVTSTATVGETPDVLTLDPVSHRLYIAAESGPLTIFDAGRARLRLVAQGDAGPNAHSVAVDPITHVVYLSAEGRGRTPLAPRVGRQVMGGRPSATRLTLP